MGRTATQPAMTHSVAQTARAAVKVRDDYFTLESTITLPPDASDATIAEAVATSTRIYQAQQGAMEALIAALRFAPAPPRPATEKQLALCASLRGKVSTATVAAVYAEIGIDGPEPRTSDQASALIDRLRAISNGVADDPAAPTEAPADAEAPATDASADEQDLPF